jgi:anhydro-N-acetylmuramic acid kinase
MEAMYRIVLLGVKRLPQPTARCCPEKALAACGAIPETPGMHLYIGLMSGTSVDAIDAVLVRIDTDNRPTLLAAHQHPLPDVLRAEIQALMLPGENEIDREGALDIQLGRLFSEAALAVLKASAKTPAEIRAIGSHGQTIRHRPHAAPAFTRQLGNPSVIAELSGITTVADFRARDIAAGGEGAPLVPAFHNALFRKSGVNRAIVNIGGIANVTFLPGDTAAPVIGFDTGPGNTLLDQWVALHQGHLHDHDGNWAASGKVINELLERLLDDEYFNQTPPKSSGREHFHPGWLRHHLAGNEPPEDVQATLAELTARSIAEAIHELLPGTIDEVYVCGGGAHNTNLLRRLRARLGPIPLATTATLGLDPDWVEAAAFAWLAHQTLAGHPGNLPSVTGAGRAVVLGGIYLA